jgi:hypothetical protein
MDSWSIAISAGDEDIAKRAERMVDVVIGKRELSCMSGMSGEWMCCGNCAGLSSGSFWTLVFSGGHCRIGVDRYCCCVMLS